MVCQCCICKLTYGVLENVSFHIVPRKEDQRMKWLIVIGREVSKSSTVCSRHFPESDFQYKVFGDEVKKFLKPGVIPSLLLTQHSDINEKSHEENNETSLIKTPVFVDHIIAEYNTEFDKENNKTGDNKSAFEDTKLLKRDGKSQEENYEMPVTETTDSINHNIAEKDNKISHSKSGSEDKRLLKRKRKEPLTGPKRFCYPRFIGDLRRVDFTSHHSFVIVQNYVKETQFKMNMMNCKINKLSKQVEIMQQLLSHLKASKLK